MPEIVMVIDGHDWKERVTYHGPPHYRIERHPSQLVCFTCGALRSQEVEPCHVTWSRKTGFAAVGGTNDG